MIACPNCGEENPERARFCVACGTQLLRAAAAEARKVVTILFSDVSGSTGLGEQLDPESLRRVLARYYDAARRIVVSHGGTVEKFIGDAVMAVFGVPQVHEDDALRALRAALELQAALASMNEELEATYGIRIETRTGVNTGEVVVGLGETFATGDAVNVAARLEQVARPGEILIGDGTRRLVRDEAELERVAPLSLKGKSEPLVAWRLLGLLRRAQLPGRLGSPLVGRDAELAQARAAWERARGGRTCLLTVVGAAGIGKSRLVHELLSSLEREARVLVGRCLAYGEGITFWPVGEIVRAAAGLGAAAGGEEARRRIAALVAGDPEAEVIAERIAGAIGLAQAAAPPQEIAWALRRLVVALARERPLVLVFDDVHWAEPTLLDLIEELAGRIADVPLLVLCMARPELYEVRPRWAEGRGDAATTIRLDSLRPADSERLIDNLGLVRLEPALRRRIAAAAEGNPLFVEEMVAMLAENGAGNGEGEVVVPPTIKALLAARLDRLDPVELAVLARGAVAGQEFRRATVAELADGAAVDEALHGLVRKDLVRADTAATGAEVFRFRHLLIRDAAYAATPKALRADLHERFARLLEGAGGEGASAYEELVGYHLERAYRLRTELGPEDARARRLAAEAAARLGEGGLRAYARADLPAAANLLERALALFPAGEQARLDLQVLLGFTLHEHGELTRAEEQLAAAEGEAAALGARAPQLGARIGRLLLGAQADPAFDIPGALEAADQAIPELERLGYDAALLPAWRLLMTLHLIMLHFGVGERAAERAVAQARRVGDVRGEIDSLYFFAVAAAVGPTPVAAGVERSERLLAEARGPQATGAVESGLAALRSMAGEHEEARRLIRGARAAFRELGLALYAEALAYVEAQVELHAGAPEAAVRTLSESNEALAAIGEAAYLSQQLAMQAGIVAGLGRLPEALELAERARRIDIVPEAKARWRAARALALAQRGEHGEALALAREAASLLEETDALHVRAEMLSALADVADAAGEPASASQALREALVLYERKGCVVCAGRARARLSLLPV